MSKQLEKDIENQKKLISKFLEMAKVVKFSESDYNRFLDDMLDNLAELLRKRDQEK